jgi:hypothetical protein
MIIITENYEWHYFQENVFDYLVSGRLMTCPCPVTGDPIIHDIEIKEIWDMEEGNDLTKVVDHDYITEHLNTLIL